MTALVFVHGFMGGSRQWQAQRDALGAVFEVITPDLPGFGENAHLPALHGIGDFADWVLDDLSGRGVERFHLVGHSMGGMIAQEMVARAPGRIERLVLYGTGAVGVLPGRFETIETSKLRARDDGPLATARRISATWFLEGEAAGAYTDCATIAERSSPCAIQAGLDAMEGWSGVDHLRHIRARTLVIWGDRDRTYTRAQTEQLCRGVPGAELVVMPGCAHAAHLERPGLFNEIIQGFLTE